VLLTSGAALALLGTAASASAGRVADARDPAAVVSEIHCSFVDSSRTVPDYATQPPSIASKVRVLPTTIWLPPNTAAGLLRPLILFAAGYDSYPGVYAPLLAAWAHAGFVVAAPIFPDENPAEIALQGVNTEGDLANEPADLAYVGHALEQASAQHEAACSGVFATIQPHAIAVAGQSDGASAAALLAFGTGTDPEGVPLTAIRAGFSLRAALIFSGSEVDAAPYGAPEPQVPLLMIQSANDHCNPEVDAVELYRAAHVNERFFLLLRTAQHRSPFDGTDSQAFALVSSTSIRFLRLAERDARMGQGFVAYGDRTPSVGMLYTNPPITPVLSPNCGPS
jgi:dienelactone hydrolase